MADVRDANNFYENYAESTKGKRRIEDFDGHFGANDDQLMMMKKKEEEVVVVVSDDSSKDGGDGGETKVGDDSMPAQAITVEEI